MEDTTDSPRALSASVLFGIEQREHQAMLQNEMHASDRFLVELASRLGVKCSNFASDEVRAQYAELRDRILSHLPNASDQTRRAQD